ncbi:hypothetical protein DNX69_10860 [Rhodopseudomonas palustris]|uniref:Uncharacterized protein n=1 Tax=Rhodopseudomonas palustris TaxID=1076 RepID=A0A323UN12_RHOPL|nr:hypothetical protein [Rhodopseudomonas palustris]PZA12466.1 hypothetical protein DNX69_10860 [Rhodopseudomonas palustris]
MIVPATISERLAASALVGYLAAVEATLKPLFPDITVRQHPGRIDVSDIVEKDIFTPPMIALAAVKWKLDGDLAGSWDLPVEAAAYIVTEDMALGGRAWRRQEVAHALSVGLLGVLGDLDASRWGLLRIAPPQKVEARPLFTSEVFAKGAAYYVVTWEQTLKGFGSSPLERPPIAEPQIFDFDGEPVDDSDGAPV